MIAYEDHAQAVWLQLEENADVNPCTDFPIGMMQTTQAQPQRPLARDKIIEQAIECYDDLRLQGYGELPEGPIVAGEVLDLHCLARRRECCLAAARSV